MAVPHFAHAAGAAELAIQLPVSRSAPTEPIRQPSDGFFFCAVGATLRYRTPIGYMKSINLIYSTPLPILSSPADFSQNQERSDE
jgi:hypothetical protein